MRLKNDIFFAEVEELLAEGRQVTILVRGNSMRPLLRDGRDKVILRRANDEDIRKGAVMLFRHRGSHVMHRVTKIEGDVVIFEGDGNYKMQEIALRKDIIAVMEAVVRPSGRRIECSSSRWRILSFMWLSQARIERRVILGIMRRLNL
jgi:signal peptidase I